ncbi:hypothetical protein F5Y13DRAFT_102737 [Hypoxylon sp. FL1857]|nr:hypothetical protein F5Y13DRAFT_102737 [Hypoxylon sp. FL1857]
MATIPFYNVDWTSYSKGDHSEVVIRSNNGCQIHYRIDPSRFIRSRQITREYLEWVHIMTSEEFFMTENPYEWMLTFFRPVIDRLLANTPPLVLAAGSLPTWIDVKWNLHLMRVEGVPPELRQRWRRLGRKGRDCRGRSARLG